MTFRSGSERFAIIRAIERRKPLLRYAASVVWVVLFFGWIVVFGVGSDMLEGTRIDLLAYLNEFGIAGIIAQLMLGFGIAIVLSVSVSRALQHRLVTRELRRHFETPICVWCGFSLEGLDSDDGAIRCPECGKRSPTRLASTEPSAEARKRRCNE